MKITQERTEVNPVFIELDEVEQNLVEYRIKKEKDDSIFTKCYRPGKGFVVVSNQLDDFWDRIEMILREIESVTEERKILVKISNAFSMDIQLPKL